MESQYSLGEVIAWAREMGESGFYNRNSALQRITSIERIRAVLNEDEPDDAAWALEHLEDLFSRWAAQGQGAHPNTLRTYHSKARVVLKDFLAAMTMEPRGGQLSLSRQWRRPPTDASRPRTDFTIVPLGEGRAFSFRAPKDLRLDEVARVAVHLCTLTIDYDPSTTAALMTALLKALRTPDES